MVNIRDIVLHALIARIAYTDDITKEFLIRLNDADLLEVDIPRDRLAILIENVDIGPKLQDFIDWLTGGRLSEFEHELENVADLIPYASTTVYGKVKIGAGINVANGIISVTGTPGEILIVTSTNYVIIDPFVCVICKASLNVTLPAAPSAGWRAVIKNSTESNTVTVIGTVDGDINPVINSRESFNMIYDGTEWNLI